MRRRSRANSKVATGRSRKAKTQKAVRRNSSSTSGQETEIARLTRAMHEAQDQQRTTSEILGVVARSRVRRASSVSWSTDSGALRRFGVTALWRCDLAGSPPALERRLIAFPNAQDKAL